MKLGWLLLLSPFITTLGICFSTSGFACLATFRRASPKFSRRAVVSTAFAKIEARPKQEDRQRSSKPVLENASIISDDIILTMYNGRYNLTSWADHHPGGISVLRKFHHRNATLAYEKVGHSPQAKALLESFRIPDDHDDRIIEELKPTAVTTNTSWRASTLTKLITKEDPFHLHKLLGIFCLLHFIYRYGLAFTGRDVSAGFGHVGGAASVSPRLASTAAFMLPHALLSSSSLLFHTVPLERVRGKPMIWKEYRWHNMAFAFRGLMACVLASLMIKTKESIAGEHKARIAIVTASSITCLATHALADVATAKLRTNVTETTITTVPFWEGCSPAMHNGVRAYYGYSQFAATLACLQVCRYPSWSFFTLPPIQLASLLMTLCRKGIITSRQFHFSYTLSLLMTLAAVIQTAIMDPKAVIDLAVVVGGAAIMYSLRRKYRINKYALWIPTAVGRVAFAACL
jgi:hypothetical protein